jgi:hypothetical protein
MGYGSIIKRAWKITWRYRALWVLGLFAGVSGSSGGGSGGGNYNFNSLNSGSGSNSNPFASVDGRAFLRTLESLLPVIVVGTLLLIVIGIAWWILSVAARGGLVFAVNEIEDGRPMRLGAAWNAGFARFWSIFGVAFILALPVFVLMMVVLLLIFVPVMVPLLRGDSPGPGVLAPICGTLIIGVPLLIVMSLVLSLLSELALRYVMLSGHGAMSAIGESWRAFRSRFKDTALMWLIGMGLNMAAGFALAIPLVILTIVAIVPAVIAGAVGKWAVAIATGAVAFLLIMALSFAFTAVWGTFSSALWTVFFRRFTGMEVLPQAAESVPLSPAGYPAAETVQAAPMPPEPMPPMAPVPPAPQPPAAPTPPAPRPPTTPAPEPAR